MKNKKITSFIKKLANLQFAISLLFLIGFIVAIGTVIEQDQPLTFYKENYPLNQPMFGFLTWQLITGLNLDQVYTAWWFLILLLLFSCSLLSCTFTTQLPSIKTFKIWKFYKTPKLFNSLSINQEIKQGLSNSFAYECNRDRYHFFKQKKSGYAYSGLLGRVSPIVVHFSIVLLLIGSSLGSLSGYTAQQFVPRGEIVHIQNLTKFGNLFRLPQEFSFRVNDFWITYTKELKTEQFYSDLSLLTNEGQEIKRKTIFVNEPLLFNDIAVYQTDWDIAGLKFELSNNESFQTPVKKITKGSRKFWLCSLPIDETLSKKVSIVLNDLNEQLYVYDSKGILLQQPKLGDSITVGDQLKFKVTSILVTTGLQVKSDPGIPTVYLSFFLLMLSIYVSFFTYSQIWVIETTKSLVIGGTSNRAVLFFQQQFRKLVNRALN